MNIGLVLSGGGMRGAAHIGVIKALEEYGIFPIHIAGSSAGAIVGELYVYGYDWKVIFSFFKGVQLLDLKNTHSENQVLLMLKSFIHNLKPL